MLKSVLMSLVVVGVVGGMVGGGLFAAFSDTETSEGNVFTAGVMDLKVNGMDDPLPPVFYDSQCLKPGDQVVAEVMLENVGCVDGWADFHLYIMEDADNGIEEPEAGAPGEDGTEDGELCENTAVTLIYDGNPVDISHLDANGDGSVSLEELDCNDLILGPLPAGWVAFLVIIVEVPMSVGNCIMGDSETVAIEFSLDQMIII
jgi:predicted ribosomally synthesized peptide with SipW-like signal peptide